LEGPIFHFHDHGRKGKHIKEALKDTSKSWYVRLLGKTLPVKTPWLPTRLAVFYSQIHQTQPVIFDMGTGRNKPHRYSQEKKEIKHLKYNRSLHPIAWR